MYPAAAVRGELRSKHYRRLTVLCPSDRANVESGLPGSSLAAARGCISTILSRTKPYECSFERFAGGAERAGAMLAGGNETDSPPFVAAAAASLRRSERTKLRRSTVARMISITGLTTNAAMACKHGRDDIKVYRRSWRHICAACMRSPAHSLQALLPRTTSAVEYTVRQRVLIGSSNNGIEMHFLQARRSKVSSQRLSLHWSMQRTCIETVRQTHAAGSGVARHRRGCALAVTSSRNGCTRIAVCRCSCTRSRERIQVGS